MKDWLGNEYDVGDLVLYAAMSGRCVTMVLGRVLEIYQGPKYGYGYKRQDKLDDDEKETKVKVQPLKSSRWKQHYGRTRYVDTRTGKGIDPYVTEKTGEYRHRTGGYFENTTTGERVYDVYDKYHPDFQHYHHWDKSTMPPGWELVKSELKPYVKEIKEPTASVTISITENIVKWDGEIDDPSLAAP